MTVELRESWILAALTRASLYEFVREFWGTVEQEKPVWNWHIKELCEIAQQACERVFRNEARLHDLVINVPPGTSKSTIFSVMLPAWVWTRMAHCQLICASFTEALSLHLADKSRRVILSDKWRATFGDVQLREDSSALGYYKTKAGGYRKSTSTDAAIVGQHANIIVIDDPVDPEHALSDVARLKSNRWIKETLGARKVSQEVTLTIHVQQRLHQDDSTAQMLARDDVKHVNLPAEFVDGTEDEVRPRRLRRYYQDGLLDPVRLKRATLANIRDNVLGEYAYAGQYLQRPTPRAGGMFKTDRFVIDEPPPRGRFRRLIRYWDKAGTAGGGAYSVGVLLGECTGPEPSGNDVEMRTLQRALEAEPDNLMARVRLKLLLDRGSAPVSKFWVLDVIRGQWDSAARERVIKLTAETDGLGVEVGLEQEPGSGGKESAENTVKMLAGWRVRVERPTGSKELRAEPFSVQVNGRNVALARAPWNAVYLDEFQHFPNSRFKDQVDASSGAFTLLSRRGYAGVIGSG